MAKKNTDKTSSATWKKRHEIAVNTQERMFQKFASWYDTMYAHINTSQYALWKSKVFIPIIPSKAWGMIAKLQSLKPGWEIGLYGDVLNDDSAQDKAEKAQWKLEHDWDNPLFSEPMAEKLFSPLVDAVVTGTGIAKLPWQYKDHVRYEKYVDETTGELDINKQVEIKSGRGFNELIPHDIMSTFVAPGAKNLYDAPWVILEDFVTHDQLEAENKAAGIELYKNLDKVKDLKSQTDQFANQKKSRNQLTGEEDPISADTTLNQFKRLECYEKSSNYIYVYAVGDNTSGDNEYIELSCRPNPYWHGKYPLVAFYVKRRPHKFWGQGVFEDTERMQSAFNDLFNHYMDSLNLSLDGMIMKPEGEEYNYVVEPGGEFLYKGTAPTQFKFPEPNPAQFNTVMQFVESQVESATVSQYALGTPNSATDKTSGTASGIKSLQEAAGDKLGFMKQAFSNSLREVGRQWLSNNQQFLDTDFTLMGQENNVPAPITITPQDLQGEMVLRVNDASMEPVTKEQRVMEFAAYLQQIQGLSAASQQQALQTQGATQPIYLDYSALMQDLHNKMGLTNLEKVIVTQEDIEAKMAEEAAMQQQQAMEQGIDPETGLPLEDVMAEEPIMEEEYGTEEAPPAPIIA